MSVFYRRLAGVADYRLFVISFMLSLLLLAHLVWA